VYIFLVPPPFIAFFGEKIKKKGKSGEGKGKREGERRREK